MHKAVILMSLLISPTLHAAPGIVILHDFLGGADGAYPLPGTAAVLVAGNAGVLYGTTAGEFAAPDYGTVFSLTPPAKSGGSWKERVLYQFTAVSAGAEPISLTPDGAGGFYGATFAGGGGSCQAYPSAPPGCGVIFHIVPNAKGKSTFTKIYSFPAGAPGAFPGGGLVTDSSGAIYGMAGGGSGPCNFGTPGCGVVFKLTPPTSGTAWTETVLYSFSGGKDGALPEAGLTPGADGAFYGTTALGGNTGCGGGGCGTIFRLTPPAAGKTVWKESVLYRFLGTGDGGEPQPAPVIDSAGNLVGTTASGGKDGLGVVYSLAPPAAGKTAWKETVLHGFAGGTDGAVPNAAVTPLTGGGYATTTYYGGGGPCAFAGAPAGCGTVVELTPPAAGKTAWKETVLHSFNGSTEGAVIAGALYLNPANGTLFGAAQSGGNTSGCTTSPVPGCGTAFEITP
jgi:uncharacterized protein YceK